MKLTKSKNAKESFFYRDAEKGKLYVHDHFTEDSTDKVINELPYNESLARRILSKCDKNENHRTNPFESFITCLIKREKANLPSKKDIGFIKTFQAGKYFSPYGCALAIKKDDKSNKLMTLLKEYYDNGIDISEDLKLWPATLQSRVEYKKERLKKSIKNNKISFPLDASESNDKKLSKSQWLLAFITDDEKFTEYENWYKYEVLYKKLGDLNANDNHLKPPQKLGSDIYKEVKNYHRELYRNKKKLPSEELKGFIFYLDEVQAYFRHYFGSRKADKCLDRSCKVKKLIGINKETGKPEIVNESYPYKWVKAHITNKITALLIQNGKLTHYGVDHPTSDSLSNIQIEESFKKQLFLSIAWATTRLNYFFDYGSNNADVLGKTKNNSKLEVIIEGDILSEFKGVNTLKATYQTCQKKQTGDTYIKHFLRELHNDNDKKQVLQEKVDATFPFLPENDNQDKTIEDLLDILDAARRSISYLRNNTFHPQKDYLYELTLPDKVKKEVKPDCFSKVKELLERDISNINDCFKKQIRSSLIADIYPLGVLQNIFANCGLDFHLYAPQYELMPAFRKVYQRGANLCSQNGDQRILSWFISKPVFGDGEGIAQKRNDGKKWQAYKNLLQMIYERSFLPAVRDDESLITKYIKETIDWSKKSSRGRDPKYCYRYKSMPTYTGQRLADYMADLQRLQSAQESEKHDDIKNEIKDKNYYIDFVQDIFVRALDHYLESKLSSVKEELLPTFGNDSKIPESENTETTLDQLFQEGTPILRMHYGASMDDDFCLLFYPFLRMLERRELANLQHQVIRYRCSLNHRLDKKDFERDASEKLEQLIAMLIFTFPDHIKEESVYKAMLEKHFKKFVGGQIGEYLDLYCQKEEKSQRFIQQKSMLALMRTGAVALYAEMFSSVYKITQDDYAKYKEKCCLGENNENRPSPIEEAQEKLTILHKELCKEKSICKDDTKLKAYEEALKFVNTYSNLRRKITFDLLYELHLIHVDILSRLAAFATDWERDMHFLLIGLYNLDQKNKTEKLVSFKDENEIECIFDYTPKPTMLSKFKDSLKIDINTKTLERLCLYNCKEKLVNVVNVRNALAHLNHMTQLSYKDKRKNEYDNQKSIMELLASVGKLLNYDLKRKNSVTRVLKELLQKYHVNLSLHQKNDYEYELYTTEDCKGSTKRWASVKSENIVHLKNVKIFPARGKTNGKGIIIAARDETFLKCVETLLNFSYNNVENKESAK